LLWAGVGLDGAIVNKIEPRQRWEKTLATVHYATLALWNSIGWDGVDLKVKAPGVDVEGRFLVAVASNIRAYAGGLVELAPEARIDDGKLDFWLLGGQSVKDVVIRLLQLWRGTHVSAPGVVHFQAAEATFYSQEPLPMQLDGEPYKTGSPVHFRVHARALRVLVPADSARLFSSA
jgi:diacylglycerol kinase family enzyme